jgi:hypothetical protein
VDRADHVRIAETNELGQVAHVPIYPEIVNQYGSGLDIHDDFPSDVIGPWPYLEGYWRTSGRDLVDQTIEFAACGWVHEDIEYENVSGQLELIA